jgi:hypothetical protein
MMKDTPVLLKTSGGDDSGFGVLAGRSKDGRAIQVLISNYQISAKASGPRANGDVLHIPNIMDITLPPRRSLTYHDNGGYNLSVTVPAGRYLLTRYRISDTQNFTHVDQRSQSGPQLRLQSPPASRRAPGGTLWFAPKRRHPACPAFGRVGARRHLVDHGAPPMWCPDNLTVRVHVQTTAPIGRGSHD